MPGCQFFDVLVFYKIADRLLNKTPTIAPSEFFVRSCFHLFLFFDNEDFETAGEGQHGSQLADINSLNLTYYTVRGSIKFAAQRKPEGLRMTISIPQDCNSELLLPKEQATTLTELLPNHPLGLKRFKLPSGQESLFVIRQGN